MRFSIFLHLQHRSHQALDHWLIIHEAFVEPSPRFLSVVAAVVDVGVIVRKSWIVQGVHFK